GALGTKANEAFMPFKLWFDDVCAQPACVALERVRLADRMPLADLRIYELLLFPCARPSLRRSVQGSRASLRLGKNQGQRPPWRDQHQMGSQFADANSACDREARKFTASVA